MTGKCSGNTDQAEDVRCYRDFVLRRQQALCLLAPRLPTP
eukprot:COSAG06_NODE_56351_length_285_cov_0.822581_1_plen_39_part_01